MDERLEFTEEGHIVYGKDEDGYPIIIGSAIWNNVVRRKNQRLQVIPFQGFTTVSKGESFAIIQAAIAAWNRRATPVANAKVPEPIGYVTNRILTHYGDVSYMYTTMHSDEDHFKEYGDDYIPVYRYPAATPVTPDVARLVEAATAVVDRWETPNWKEAEHTAVFIHALRDALAALGRE